jgi:acetylornithine/succinyldiaminopimelate/putrescine aminotransferase
MASIETIKSERLVERSEELGAYLQRELLQLDPLEVRGLGLMVGLDLEKDCKEVVQKAACKGILLNSTGDHTLRLVPPLVVEREQIDVLVRALGEILQEP